MTTIYVSGFKSFKSVTIKLNPINILIGANGSGKSNFLSFFEMLRCIYDNRLAEYIGLNGGAERFLHKGPKVTNRINASLVLNNVAYQFELRESDGHFVFAKEGIIGPDGNYSLSVQRYTNESSISYLESVVDGNPISDYLKNISEYHFHDTGKLSLFNSESNVNSDIFYLYHDGKNLAAFLYEIQSLYPRAYQRIIKVIQSIAPYFRDFYLKPNASDGVRLLWRDKYSEIVYPTSALSDGTLRFIALTVLFMQPNPAKVIVIDEPELGLHPQAIAKLAGMIKSVSSRGVQVIVATQSADLISAFTPEDIITINQVDGESHFERLDSEKLSRWLDDYTLGDLWKTNIIQGGQPR